MEPQTTATKDTKLGGPSQTSILFVKFAIMFYNNPVVFHILTYSLTSVFQIIMQTDRKSFNFVRDVIRIYFMTDISFTFKIMWLFLQILNKNSIYFYLIRTKYCKIFVKLYKLCDVIMTSCSVFYKIRQSLMHNLTSL